MQLSQLVLGPKKMSLNDMRISGGISGDRIDDKIVNLSNFTKKMSFKAGFFPFKACLAFI